MTPCDLVEVYEHFWGTSCLHDQGRSTHSNYEGSHSIKQHSSVLVQYTTSSQFNPLKPNDSYSGRTAPLTSERCILYIYSTSIGIAYFKHGIYSPFFPLQNAVCFIILTYLVSGRCSIQYWYFVKNHLMWPVLRQLLMHECRYHSHF